MLKKIESYPHDENLNLFKRDIINKTKKTSIDLEKRPTGKKYSRTNY